MSKYSILVWTLFVLLVVCLPSRDAWLFGGGGGDAEEPAEAEEPAAADDEDLPLKTTHPSKDFELTCGLLLRLIFSPSICRLVQLKYF